MIVDTLIVDDEPIARSVLREELEQFGQIRIVGEADTGSEALRLIQEYRPNLVFLDLQMPGLSGFDVIEQTAVGSKSPVFIVVTAFDRFAIQAFESHAIDYLLKPIRYSRLAEAIDKATRFAGEAAGPTRHLAAVQDVAIQMERDRGGVKPVRRILARNGSEFLLLTTDEVFAFQADGDIVWVITERDRYVATEILQSIQDKLRDASFKRVHRGVLVNTNHIRKVSPLTSQRWLLTLSNDLQFAVSKRQTKSMRGVWSW